MNEQWKGVGQWLVDHAGQGAALVGSLMMGNVPGAVAAGVSMVQSATGQTDPAKVLDTLQTDPQTVIKLRQMANENEADIRRHLEAMTKLQLEDEQSKQHEQQETIRSGDAATDEYVRRTRPKMARQSWYAALAYLLLFSLAELLGQVVAAATGTKITISGPSVDIAAAIGAPAMAYMGFRAVDKWSFAKYGQGVVAKLKGSDATTG